MNASSLYGQGCKGHELVEKSGNGNFTETLRLRKLTEIEQKQDCAFLITKGKMRNMTNYFVFITTLRLVASHTPALGLACPRQGIKPEALWSVG